MKISKLLFIWSSGAHTLQRLVRVGQFSNPDEILGLLQKACMGEVRSLSLGDELVSLPEIVEALRQWRAGTIDVNDLELNLKSITLKHEAAVVRLTVTLQVSLECNIIRNVIQHIVQDRHAHMPELFTGLYAHLTSIHVIWVCMRCSGDLICVTVVQFLLLVTYICDWHFQPIWYRWAISIPSLNFLMWLWAWCHRHCRSLVSIHFTAVCSTNIVSTAFKIVNRMPCMLWRII